MENYFFIGKGIFNNFDYFRYCLKSVYSARFFCAANDSSFDASSFRWQRWSGTTLARVCALTSIYSSGITLFRERVLHDASSVRTRWCCACHVTDTSCSLYFISLGTYTGFRAIILYFTPRLRSCRVIRLQHGCNEKLSLL